MPKFDWREQIQHDLAWDGQVTTAKHPAVAARLAAQQAAFDKDAHEQYVRNQAAAADKESGSSTIVNGYDYSNEDVGQ